ncbi:MAG TPA: hypothetical protein VNC78_11615 [Actinomycetota bacterium]|nr:hypothetical protein [Actinomycetota bacterium]
MRLLRQEPLALLPLALQGVAGGVLILIGLWPGRGATATATAVFPLDIYFDMKHLLAEARGWAGFVPMAVVLVALRAAVLAATLWASGARPKSGRFLMLWARCARLAFVSAALLFPCAVLFFSGAAMRYAPFIWVGALGGLGASLWGARRAAVIEAGGKPAPTVSGYLGYAATLMALSAAMSVLSRSGPVAVALLVASFGPLHCLFFLGWREQVRSPDVDRPGRAAIAVTGIAALVFFGASFYDRALRSPPPVATADTPGRLLLLGGADSTSTTGALTELNPRDVGVGRDRTTVLSYRGPGETYKGSDTRVDLGKVAGVVAEQIEAVRGQALLLGHSQASLILDRLFLSGGRGPDRSVELSPPPPVPPSVTVPPPGRAGRGKPGGDAARVFSGILDLVGLPGFDIDAPSAPVRLEAVVPKQDRPRLAIWALGDAAWLDGDWRRSDSINLVAFTDHVGVTNDERSLELARRFLQGNDVPGDAAGWRGFVVATMRYVFEPWRAV